MGKGKKGSTWKIREGEKVSQVRKAESEFEMEVERAIEELRIEPLGAVDEAVSLPSFPAPSREGGKASISRGSEKVLPREG